MRPVGLALLIAGILCELFAYWGLKTMSGRRVFDEMAGMIPLAAIPAGLFLFLMAAVVWWRNRSAF